MRQFRSFGVIVAAALTASAGAQNILPGYYTGSWTNTTFSVTAPLKADVFVRNGLLTLVLDVDGSVFGDPNPVPILRSAPMTPSGVTFAENAHPTWGNVSINISPGGTITIGATNVPSGFVSGYNSTGIINGGTISGTGVVNLKGGGTANGIASAIRTPYSTLISDHQLASGGFGFAVAGVPDVDGDGRGDVVVGAPGENPTGLAEAGRAYIISGTTGNVIRELISPGREIGGHFGTSVAGIPDVNGDGRGDVVIGSPDEDPGTNPNDTGRAYIYSGATGALLWKLIPPTPVLGMHFGAAVSGVADLNGDARGDVLVGAPQEQFSGAPVGAGRVYVYNGATGQRIRTISKVGPLANDFFGFAVAGVPDVNADGRGDILIGAPAGDEDTLTGRPGKSYLYSGSNGGLLATLQSPGNEADNLFGFSVAGVPDTNGDGKGDLVIGSPEEDPGASPAGCGRANLYSGATGSLLFRFLPPTPIAGGNYGFAVAGVADVNGDGRGDVIIGAPGEPASHAGRVHIYSGATGVRLSTHGSVYPEVNGAFGTSVGGVADFSGNGRGDVVAGSPKENPVTAPAPPTDAGRAYLIRR